MIQLIVGAFVALSALAVVLALGLWVTVQAIKLFLGDKRNARPPEEES